jgi:hypothetical protein
MLNYWQPGYEWMGHGLQGHWCPSFAHYQLQSPDVSGLGSHGQLVNFANNGNNALVTGDGKAALNFNGVNNHVAVSRWSNMERDYSVFVWLRTTHAASNTAMIASSFNGGGGAHLMGVKGSNGALYTFDGAIEVEFTAKAINDGVWHLATIVRRFGRSMTGYVDGVQVGLLNDSRLTGNPSSLGAGWRLGGTPFFGAQFPGLLDDFRIYSLALTAQEILATYQADRGGGMGYQPPLRRSYAALLGALVLACDTGNYTLSGQSAGLFASRSLAADQAQYLLSGNAANTLATRLLSSDPATYNATGNDAATLCARLLDGGAAAYALTGTDAGLIANRKLTADQAVCFLAGNNAELLRSLKLNAGSMQLQLDNFAASLLANRKISADGAQYILVVYDANLTSSASGVAPYYYLFMMRGPQ